MGSYFLYAEDDRDDAYFFRDILRTQKQMNEVAYVANGYDLLQYLQQIKLNAAYPCLIIMDLKLPRLNGIDTLQLLKTDDIYRLIPVVILSSNISPADEDTCRQLGAEVLVKPDNHVQWNKVLLRLQSYSDDECK